MPSYKKALLCAAILSAGTAYGAESYQLVSKIPGLKAPPVVPTFESVSFTNCGMTGRTGPSEAQCRSEYNGSPILDSALSFSVTGGIQSWVVQDSGTYKIEAWGAQGGAVGGYRGGYGAKAVKEVALLAGDQVRVLVGQVGVGAGQGAGGGGGTYVVKGSAPLVVAGGGGGATSYSNKNGFPGLATTSGGNSSLVVAGKGIGGTGGQGGSGG